MAEMILGRPLSGIDRVYVCSVKSYRRCCCKTHYAQPLLSIDRLHVISGPNHKSHTILNVFLYQPCEEEYILPVFACGLYTTSDIETFTSHSYEVARTWLKNCLQDHADCPDKVETRLPRRLIFIGNGIEGVQLIENSEASFGRYTCLSHCWGAKQPLRTTRNNIEAHRLKIDWERIPRTFQDAIKLTQHLGISYLWIDSLCIIQDDSDDWAEESGKMCNIYENSYLTIAATSASNSSQGLSIRESANHVRLRGSIQSGISFDIVGYKLPHWSTSTFATRGHPHPHIPAKDNPPLFSRAWAFQERILALRVVHFCGEELIWECRSMTFCECQPPHFGGTYPKVIPKHVFHRNLKLRYPASMVWSWHLVVEEYLALNLSPETDKLPVLSGLAKHNGRGRLSAQYLAGLWSNSLMIDLFWSSCYSHLINLDRGPELWRAPSWSWASQNTAVRFPARVPELMISYIDLVSCETTPATLDPTGKVSAGSLVVSGKLLDARIIRRFRKGQELEENESKKGTLTLAIETTGARVQSRFTMFDSGRYVLKGIDESATVAMDSPLHLLHSEDYYEGSQIKCLQLARVGYKELLEGKGATWEEEQKQKKPNATDEDVYEQEGVGEEKEEEEEEEEEDDEEEEEEKGQQGSEAGEETDQGQDKAVDWVCKGNIQQYFRQLVRSSAEYSLVLQKVKGENTYRRIGMVIQHRSVGPNEPPRHISTLWRDSPSALDSDEGFETTITIL